MRVARIAIAAPVDDGVRDLIFYVFNFVVNFCLSFTMLLEKMRANALVHAPSCVH